MRRLVALLMIAGIVLVASQAGARGNSDRRSPPRLTLRHQGEVVQRASAFTYCWTYTDGGGGTGMCADGFPRYPRAARVEAPAKMVLRIHYPGKPTEWFLNAYRAIVRHEHYDEPVGSAEEVPFRLRPHRIDGTTKAWDLVFRLTEPARHYYLDTGGYLQQGDAFYALHARTI